MDITQRLRDHALPDPNDEREVMHAPLLREAADEIDRLREAAMKAERRAIMFGDSLHQQILAMRAAMVDGVLNGPEAGMAWIENTLEGPGNLPDIDAARAEGGAQCMFNREMAEHEAFRAAHPTPNAEVSGAGTASAGLTG